MLPVRHVLRQLELSPQALATILDAVAHTRDAAGPEHHKQPHNSVCGQRCSIIHTSTSMGGPAWQAFHALDTQPQPSTSGAMHGHSGYGHSKVPNRNRGLKTAAKQASSQADDDDLTALSELLQGDQRAMLTPAAIVEALDRYIVGQADAKRAVAVAMRNRWRRSRLPRLAADEVMPKNILMVGPTGVGKTEIARRLAKLADAPFIKVEATKYTELGYVGRDVEDIIKDLVEASQALVRQRLQQHAAAVTNEKVENVILNALCGEHSTSSQRDTFRDLYRQGMLDERVVDVELPSGDANTNRVSFEGGVIIMDHVAKANKAFGGSKRPGDKQKFKVSEARAALEDAEADKLMSSEQVTHEAIRSAEQDGIVFIDEIDKIVEASGGSRMSGGGSVSSDGVQRDLLPIVEGSVVPTKYGNVDTSHILFICSGAFHSAKPSDMLAELQGRLPIRVSLQGLTAHDFFRILTEPENNMIKQQKALLATEDVDLRFSDGAIKAIAKVAEEVNRLLDNIGARRLHTVIERIIADISYSAPELAAEAKRNGQPQLVYHIDEAYVHQVMQPLLAKKDLSRYVL